MNGIFLKGVDVDFVVEAKGNDIVEILEVISIVCLESFDVICSIFSFLKLSKSRP